MTTQVSLFVMRPEKPTEPGDLVQSLRQVSGVTAVHADPTLSQVTVAYHPHKADTFTLVTAVRNAGYDVMTKSMALPVSGMNCASCAFHVEGALVDVPGVVEANVDLRIGTAFWSLRPKACP